jgi:hypothetical protein
MESFPKEQILNQICICRDRFEKMRLDLLEKFVYNNEITDASARLDGWNLAAEMTLMVTRLSIEGVTSLGPDFRELQQKVNRLSANASSSLSIPLKMKEEGNSN